MHLHDDEQRIFTGAPDEIVCECLNVERQEIEQAITATAATTVGQVRRECAAGGGCGACHEEVARMILGHHFGRELDFDHEHHDYSNEALPVNAELARQVEEFLREKINPDLALLGVEARIIEVSEEIVIDLSGADEELKYTLGFWIDTEFSRRFSPALSVIVA